MNDWKRVITLATCCCISLTMVPSASADFVGVTTVYPDDPDTDFQCTQGNGAFVPGPLIVCDLYADFDNPENELLNVANAELQVYDGANPDVFFHHPFNFNLTAPHCEAIPVLPDLICDTFITIGLKCQCSAPCLDGTSPDSDFNGVEFEFNGHIVGGWLNLDPHNTQGHASEDPDSRVLFLRSSMAQGLTLSGEIDFFWWDDHNGDVFADLDVPIECVATCGSCPTDTDGDGDTDAMDLAVLLGNWGPVDAGNCQDADGDGLIGAFDLAVLLGIWGPCL